ncbi:MAG TPA: GNAT family N-acetyltransferase [Tepidisphaeraceae bacterium]
MPRLSNFLWSRDREPAPITCGRVEKPQIEPALRLLLCRPEGLADDQAVLEFLSFASERKIDIRQMWIAQVGEEIAWTLLPITNPGRTMLLFTPAHIPQAICIPAAEKLTDAICSHWHDHGMQLAQLLLDPQDTPVCDLYLKSGFELLAELIYLQRTVRKPAAVEMPAGFSLTKYSDQTHADFADAIQRSYEGSLDCPSLNGRRGIEDVIAGHKSTGVFDPTLWHLLREGAEPRGVLILSPSQYADALELVYLGLTPPARGRGLGDLMMRIAFDAVPRQQRSDLTLAVDSHNQPAMNLYFRHGLKRIGSRLAMLRELRSPAV